MQGARPVTMTNDTLSNSLKRRTKLGKVADDIECTAQPSDVDNARFFRMKMFSRAKISSLRNRGLVKNQWMMTVKFNTDIELPYYRVIVSERGDRKVPAWHICRKWYLI